MRREKSGKSDEAPCACLIIAYNYSSCNGLHSQSSFHFRMSEFAVQVSSWSSVGFTECNSQTARKSEFRIHYFCAHFYQQKKFSYNVFVVI